MSTAQAEGKAVRPCRRFCIATHPEGEREAGTDCWAKSRTSVYAPCRPIAGVHCIGCAERGICCWRGDIACRVRAILLVAPEERDLRAGAGVDLGGRAEGFVRRVKVPTVGHFASRTDSWLRGLEFCEPLHLFVRRRVVEERKLVEAGTARIASSILVIVELLPHTRTDMELLKAAPAEEIEIRDLLATDVKSTCAD